MIPFAPDYTPRTVLFGQREAAGVMITTSSSTSCDFQTDVVAGQEMRQRVHQLCAAETWNGEVHLIDTLADDCLVIALLELGR